MELGTGSSSWVKEGTYGAFLRITKEWIGKSLNNVSRNNFISTNVHEVCKITKRKVNRVVLDFLQTDMKELRNVRQKLRTSFRNSLVMTSISFLHHSFRLWFRSPIYRCSIVCILVMDWGGRCNFVYLIIKDLWIVSWIIYIKWHVTSRKMFYLLYKSEKN